MNVVVFGFAISLDRHGRDSHVHYITPDHHVHFAAFDDAPMGRQLNRDQTTLIPEQSAVEEALAIAKTIIDANLEKEAGLLVRAIEAKRAHAHEAALTAAWPVLEKLLTRVWIAYLDSNKRRRYPPGVVVGGTRADGGPVDTETYEFIDRRRRDALTNVNSFTAGTISEVLSLLDEIDYSAYRAMARARKARNDWMHDLKPVDSLDVDAAFDGVSALMAKLHGISFEIRVGGSLSGFGREEFDRRRAEIARERALGSQSEAG